MSVYGRIVTPQDIEHAATDTLQAWMPAYIAEIERHTGRQPRSLPMIRSWRTLSREERWPEDQTPALAAVCPGLLEPPRMGGEETYSVRYVLGVLIVTSAKDEESTRELVHAYSTAATVLLSQHSALGGIAVQTDWVDYQTNRLLTDSQRTVIGAASAFVVSVDDVFDADAGPVGPPPDDPYQDPGDFGLSVSADVTVEKIDG